MNVQAAVTVFGEGPRGHLAKHLIRRLHQEDRLPAIRSRGTRLLATVWTTSSLCAATKRSVSSIQAYAVRTRSSKLM